MENRLQGETESLIAKISSGYRQHPYIVSLEAARVPDREVIIKIIQMLRALFFPGYFRSLAEGAYEYCTGALVMALDEKLRQEICTALMREASLAGVPADGFEAAAQHVSRSFIQQIPDITAMLAADVQAAYSGDPAAVSRDEIILAYPGVYALSVYRAAHALLRLGVPLLPRIMTEYAHGETGIDLHPGAEIGKYCFIDHGAGVVVGETAVVGEGVKLYQGVTLGALSTRGGQGLRGQKRHPTLEDAVTVYAGAMVLGGETIVGKGAVIGCNAVVTRSVPPGAKITGNIP